MPCNGISIEDYRLWPLGLTEAREAELIRSHLAEGCHTCLQAVRESVDFWAIFGAAASFGPDVAPSPRARTRLLEAIEHLERPALPMKTPAKVVRIWRPQFVYVAIGIAAAVIVAVAIGWQFDRRPAAPGRPPAESSARLDTLNEQISNLQAKLNISEKELANVRDTPAPVPPTPEAAQLSQVRAVTLRNDPNPDYSEMDKALAEANAQLQQLKATLAGEQAKSARLAQEFDQQASSIATLTRGRRDAEANLAAAMGRLAERDRQIKALDAKIAMLEHDKDRLNDAITNQKGRVDHAVRLVSLLSTPTAKFVRLSGTEAAPNASGYAILAEGNRLIFTGAHLPNLQGGKVYQLWLMRGKNPGIVSGGIFQGGTDQATIEVSDPALLNDVKALAVTDEPQGGSPLPTGHKMLIGAAKS
jgi:anti-sigma-K factor RskA